MKSQFAVAVAWVVGMLFAPDNLILLGNSAGSNGAGFILLLPGVMFAYILHSRCYHRIASGKQGAAGEFECFRDTLGLAAAMILSLAPRVLSAVFLATATLVASGFVFNEVFFQRFPNFAFAFLLLGALLAINIYSRELSEKIQILLSGTAVTGLIVLSIAGIFHWPKTFEIVYTSTRIPPLKESIAVLLLFVGFDLFVLVWNPSADHELNAKRYLLFGICLAGAVFCFWGIASLLHVPAERLADTTIPHIIAARKILGQSGRIIMGLVIIAGTGAAVNALFMAVGEKIADVGRKAALPFLPRVFNRSSTTMVFLALVTAVMMAIGVAGTDELDTYVRGSLILWLLNYAILHLVLLLPGTRQAPQINTHLPWRQIAPHGAMFMLMLTGSLILIVTDDNPGLLSRYLSIIFLGVGFPIWLAGRMQSRRRSNHGPEGK